MMSIQRTSQSGKDDASCPCQSGRAYAVCCGPVHADIRAAIAPEHVVRARFSAQVLGKTAFFRQSITRRHRDLPQVDEFLSGIGRRKYEAITITSSARAGWLRRRATVVCRIYEAGRRQISAHAERIHLKREDHAWRVVSIDLVLPERDAAPRRNAPCPCGSGKKYKHCCGSGASALPHAEMESDHKKTSIRMAPLLQ